LKLFRDEARLVCEDNLYSTAAYIFNFFRIGAGERHQNINGTYITGNKAAGTVDFGGICCNNTGSLTIFGS